MKLKDMDPDKAWFIINLAQYANKEMKCWPSNKRLAKDMKWSLRKMQTVKADLLSAGILLKVDRLNSTSVYKINTDFVGIWTLGVEVGVKEGDAETCTPPCTDAHKVDADPCTLSISNEVLVIEDVAAPPPKSTVYQDSIELYDQFCKRTIGTGAKINGAEGKAMKDIISYLRTNSQDKTDAGVLKALTFIFSNWDILEPYLRSRKKLVQINSDLVNIINCLRNGNAKQQGTTAESLRKLNDLVRRQEAGNA